jgi:hypothetical protein
MQAASTRDDSGRKLRGRILKFQPADLSRKLEAEVRELNEFLAKQRFGGGCVHRGYVRIFQNGDDALFKWNEEDGCKVSLRTRTTNNRAAPHA